MNNVIIMGKVISKSKIHFDYKDKLKAYFYITAIENNNIFNVLVSEKYMKLFNIDTLYRNINLCNTICVYGNINKAGNKYYILCKEIYMII